MAGMYSAWGGYAPGFGMIGTLIGLVQMMQNLNDIQSIAVGMGVALLTTFYGSFLAIIKIFTLLFLAIFSSVSLGTTG